jgi:dual specificity tyrosine-phosphorylation-regulated kinase 2/3/4
MSRGELNTSRAMPMSEAELDSSPCEKPTQLRKSILDKMMSEVSTMDDHPDTMQPMHFTVAVKRFSSQLTEYEHREITEVSQVYYLGTKAIKVELDETKPNHGFDNERGFYRLAVGDHIAYRYEIICSLGRGAFGQVVKAFDYKRSEEVAIKIIRNSSQLTRQASLEIKLLNLLRTKDAQDERNVVKMKNYFMFRNHVCISFELMSLNLYDFMKNSQFKGMNLTLVLRIAVQILVALGLLRSLNVIHCDLKPENILFKQAGKSGIKLVDFGSSCLADQTIHSYIQSRFYRAPEVIMELKYSRPIDMWSLGCILAELVNGIPIFPGENEVQMLLRMQEILGPVPVKLAASSPRRQEFFNADFSPVLVKDRKSRVHRPSTLSLEQVVRCEDSAFLDFISRCLTWDPADRLQPDAALKHPWIVGESTNSRALFESSSCSKFAKKRLSRSLRN